MVARGAGRPSGPAVPSRSPISIDRAQCTKCAPQGQASTPAQTQGRSAARAIGALATGEAGVPMPGWDDADEREAGLAARPGIRAADLPLGKERAQRRPRRRTRATATPRRNSHRQ